MSASPSNKKKKDILKYSNPDTVKKRLSKYASHYNTSVKLEISTRKDKKYMIRHPKRNVTIHFGQYGYEDYTKHKDTNRRRNFRLRNESWKTYDPFTPAHLSYYLLW